jgi:hypothetical protein
MKTLALVPHVGIGPIKLGDSRTSVRAALVAADCPLHSEDRNLDHFESASIQVEYEADGTASFIGISSDPDIALSYGGIDLFDTEAKRVFELLALRDGSGAHDFAETEYLFPSQIVTLYEADTQYDRKRAETRSIWGQIGCGDTRYLKAVRK